MGSDARSAQLSFDTDADAELAAASGAQARGVLDLADALEVRAARRYFRFMRARSAAAAARAADLEQAGIAVDTRTSSRLRSSC